MIYINYMYTMIICIMMVIHVVVSLAENVTLVVPSSSTRCYSDVFNEKMTYKIVFTVKDGRDENNAQDKIEHHVYVHNTYESNSNNMLGSDTKKQGNFVINHYNGTLILSVCADNFREDGKNITVKFEQSSGLDLNDFSELPLQVRPSYLCRTKRNL